MLAFTLTIIRLCYQAKPRMSEKVEEIGLAFMACENIEMVIEIRPRLRILSPIHGTLSCR